MAETTRRSFLKTAAAAVALAPAIHVRAKTDTRVVLGAGDHQYLVEHDWLKLPPRYTWQITHNVAVDQQGMLYVIQEGVREQADHPAIFVFDPEGEFVRAFGHELQGGGHGLEVHREGEGEFLYASGYQHLHCIEKRDLLGELVWRRSAPMESGLYEAGEETRTDNQWGRTRFHPTNFAFLPDGDFLVADGYGAYCIHRYTTEGEWKSHFGGPGKTDGSFDLPHGIAIDSRDGENKVVVADRVNARLQWFTPEGQHLKTQGGFILPANLDTFGDLLLTPDLASRVTLLGKDNQVIAHLGDDPEWSARVSPEDLRAKPAQWRAGRFIHPHDACFSAEGDIYVAEWVASGRVSRLKRL